MKKKTIIIGIGGIIAITSAVVIPFFIINNDNKNKEDVETIIKILKSKSSSEKTLILEGNSTGKIISNNKSKIIAKIKKLIGIEKLRGVKFDVSLENDVDISTTEKFIIVTVKKEKYSQQLKGKNGLKVKRAKSVQEIKIDTIKKYLNNSDNLNLTLPKTNYSTDNEILVAIRKLLATQINNIEINDTNLITKKENSSEVVSVATYSDEETTPYEITIDNEDFTLNLNQEEFSEDEKNVKNIKQSLESLTSKEITIDASSGSINNNKNSILGKLQTLSGYPSNLKGVSLSVKDSSDSITLEGVAFIIELSKGDVNEELRGFTVKRSQSQDEIDQNDIDEIKELLNVLNSKEVTIAATSGSITTNKNWILEKLQTLSDYPSNLKGVSLSIKDSSDLITLEGVAFIIELSKGSVVNQELRGFTVKRSQSQDEIDQNDIDEIKELLNVLNSKEVTIAATSGSITTNKNLILEKLQTLSDYPSNLKGVSLSIKDSSDLITLEGVAFIIELSKGSVINQELRGFIVKRSQSQAEIEQNDIDEIKELLNVLNSKEVTIAATSGSITTNKNWILEKLQTLSGYPSDLKGVSLSIKDSSDSITLEGVAFIIELSKGDVNEELRGFTVKRSKTQIEKIKNNIKEYLKIPNNLNIFLPKDTGSDYDEDFKILVAIRKQFEILKPLDSEISKNDFDNLITKKQSPTPTIEVATHDAKNPTSYEIIIDGENFVLKLKQNQYTSEEEKNTIINSIKTYLENEDNLNLILPKDIISNYNEDSKILIAIKTKLINSISNFKNYDANLIIKKLGSNPVTRVATHDATTLTLYEITIGGENFILKLKQDQFTELEKTKINNIKNWLNTLDNLNIILPKDTGSDYNEDSKVLMAIKKVFVDGITSINDDDFDDLITKKEGSEEVTLVANYDSSTSYIIVVGEDEFTLNLKQDQFTELEKTKINTIETYLTTPTNQNLILPQTIYSNDDDILNAIKLKVINDIEDISSSDSHLINRKDSTIDEVAVHGQPSTQYIIVVGEHEFTLNLNQDQFNKEEKTKISVIKTYLENLDNFNLILPKTTYSNDDDILNAIKLKFENDIESISSSDFHLINRKDSTIDEVAVHGQPSTQYIIVVGEHEFTLNLNQDQFNKEEKTKISVIKTYLENLDNFNLILPKTTYSNNDDILNAIKLKIENDIEDISNSDSYLIVKKDSNTVNEVVAHDAPIPTSYEITVGEHEFTLKLKQDQFTKEEKAKNNTIQIWLRSLVNWNLILPKTNYDNDNSILEAIKLKLVNDINGITTSDSHLIVKKVDSNAITSVATHDEASTQYEISIGEHDFILNLNQEEFSLEEKDKIETIKTHLETLDNLNLILPKTTYSNNDDILNAIKLKIENDIKDISNSDSYLIVKKDSNMVNEVVAHDAPIPTSYEITVGKHKFILKLKQDQFTINEKIDAIKVYLKSFNLNIIIPKTTYNNKNDVLEAIRLKLINNIEEITNSDSYLIYFSIPDINFREIPPYNEVGVEYLITIHNNSSNFSLNLNQDQFTKQEKIEKIKTYLETPNNLNLVLPKTTYGNDNSILEAIKVKLVDDIEGISSSDSNLINKKEGSNPIIEVVAHNAETQTQYIITIGGKDFTLKLKQDEFTIEQKAKINIINEYLKNLYDAYDGYFVFLPKTIYNTDNEILAAIRKRLTVNIKGINELDANNLINKKESSKKVTSVAIHGETSTPYEITIGEYEFILSLNQDKNTEEEKNEIIKQVSIYLKNEKNRYIKIQKYSPISDILYYIREHIIKNVTIFARTSFNLISKKEDFQESDDIAKWNEEATLYIITIGDEDFTFKINKEKYSDDEKIEIINLIKTYLENQDNLNIILPKVEASNYDQDDKILIAIKKAIIDKIQEFNDYSDNFITKKSGEADITSVANHGAIPTPYKITVGEKDFTLKLNQNQFTKEEK